MSLSDAAGNRQNPVAYLASGTSSTGAPPAGAGFGYAGYRYDAETGLYYVRQRHYDPRLGRFLQPDCKTACKYFQILECAPGGGQNERFELIPLAGLPEDGSHDEASITQRRVQAASC